MNDLSIRKQIIAAARRINSSGLNQGTSGNISVRYEEGFLITPSAVSCDDLVSDDIVFMHMDGTVKPAVGTQQPVKTVAPSSEWRFHRDILMKRTEVAAVIHTHSTFAISLACHRLDIPAFHYMIAIAGGNSIRCAPYATFGTQALSDNAFEALENRQACLLANHGMIVIGSSLKAALDLAFEVENLCEQYWRALQIGNPNILSDEEMERVIEKFKDYGKPS